MKKWSEMFPHGRYIYYEGVDPDGFVAEIKSKFGFDPSKNNPRWNEPWFDAEGDGPRSYSFYCPAEYLDEIYSDKYPMGS